METDYLTVAAPATAAITEKKSEFIATVAPVADEPAALAFVDGVRAQHRTAAHNVWAFRLWAGGRERCSDDGEPAKTAGMPVLGVLAGARLCNCVLVVTRYFGGTLLGTGGLVRAYSAAAGAAVQAARIATVRALRRLTLVLPYPLYDPALRLIESAGAVVEDTDFAEAVTLRAVLPAAEAPPLQAALAELLRGGPGLTAEPDFQAPWGP